MTSEQYKERIAKNEERIEKKKLTIEKKLKSIDKKKAMLIKAGIPEELLSDKDAVIEYIRERNSAQDTSKDWNELYWAASDLFHCIEDVPRLYKEIAEIEKVIENAKAALSKASATEDVYKQLPQIMLDAEADLVAEWDDYDAKRKAFLRDKLAEYENEAKESGKNSYAGFKKFINEFRYSEYNFMQEPAADTHRNNANVARSYIIDLYRRVINITGDITDIKGLTFNQHALNGLVIGTQGRARVDTILAGGYNIQRLHCRTLVHEVN